MILLVIDRGSLDTAAVYLLSTALRFVSVNAEAILSLSRFPARSCSLLSLSVYIR